MENKETLKPNGISNQADLLDRLKSPVDWTICFNCKTPFDYKQKDTLPFFTVVIKCHTKHCCPECFPEYRKFWMG